MSPIARQFLVIALKVTFFVIVAGHQTMAQSTCRGLYAEATSVRVQSFLNLRDLFNTAGALFAAIHQNPGKYTVQDLTTEIQRLEDKVKKYFDRAGISYEPQPAVVQVQGLKQTIGWQKIEYSTFRITGSKTGDDVSRMIFGVQSDRHLQAMPPQFHFDPLFELRNEGDLGHFRSESNSITFGSFAILYKRLHLGDTLRHEIHHYFEFLKVINGQMTLARIEMNNMAILKSEDYAQKLEGDELESHLRDLRGMLNTGEITAMDKSVSPFRSEEKNRQTTKDRKVVVDATIARLERLAQSTKDSLSKIESQLADGGSWVKETISSDGKTLHIIFKLTRGDIYPIIKMNLTGLVSPAHYHSKEHIQAAVLQALSWSQNRVAQVQTELQAMKSKP